MIPSVTLKNICLLQVMSLLSRSQSRLSYSDVMLSQRESPADTVKLFRNLWLYMSLFKFLEGGWPSDEHLEEAAGRIAAATPLMIIDAAGNRHRRCHVTI